MDNTQSKSVHADESSRAKMSARNDLSLPDDRKSWSLKATSIEYSPYEKFRARVTTSEGQSMPIFSPLTEKTQLDLIEDKSEVILRYSIRKSEDENSASWIPIEKKYFDHLQSGGTLLIDNMVLEVDVK